MYNIIYKNDIMESALSSVISKKDFGYNVYFFYGDQLEEMDCDEYNLFFESGFELCSYIKDEIEDTYLEYKDTSYKGLPLVLVMLEIINSDAVINSDDFPNAAICDITIYDPNKSVNELKDGLLEAANDVFHSDEQ